MAKITFYFHKVDKIASGSHVITYIYHWIQKNKVPFSFLFPTSSDRGVMEGFLQGSKQKG